MSSVLIKKHSKYCILHAAAQLFAKLGLDKCSTREIAKVSDSNISLISYYFGGKEGLYRQVLREHALKVKAEVQEVLGDELPQNLTKELFVNDMSFLIDHMINSHIENPDISKIFAREKLTGFPHSKDIQSEIFYPLISKFFRLFEAGQNHGFVKKDIKPALFFIALYEGICGFYILMDCDTQLAKDCVEFKEKPQILREQLMKIYLTGVLE